HGGAMLRERALTTWKDTTASRAATSSRAARKIFSKAIGAATGTPPVSEVKINEVYITSRLSVEAMAHEIVHYFWWGKSVGSISASRASLITRPESGELRRSSAKASSRAAEVSYLWERGLSPPGCIAKSTPPNTAAAPAATAQMGPSWATSTETTCAQEEMVTLS